MLTETALSYEVLVNVVSTLQQQELGTNVEYTAFTMGHLGHQLSPSELRPFAVSSRPSTDFHRPSIASTDRSQIT